MRVILLVDLRGGQTGSVPGAKPTESDPFQGEFVVQADGAIYGAGFGRIIVKNKTVLQAQKLVRTAMTKLVKPEEVIVTLGSQREQHIFLVGNGTGTGFSKYVPGLTLRQALASAPPVSSPDLTTATVFRDGKQVEVTNVDKLLRGGLDFPLNNDDVVTITPEAELRVWITGAVKSPGRILLQEGATLQQALAAAGGALVGDAGEGLAVRGEYQVQIRRGENVQSVRLDQALQSPQRLEQGDSVAVIAPVRAQITIAGEVKSPGEFTIREGEPIITAVSRAGGILEGGTLDGVLVYRGGQTISLNAAIANELGPQSMFKLQAGDVVLVTRNNNFFYAFGSSNKQGKIFIPEGKDDSSSRCTCSIRWSRWKRSASTNVCPTPRS